MNNNSLYEAKLAPASFSISITGHRDLSILADTAKLKRLISNLLQHIENLCTKCDADIELRFLSALAAGADQIAAASALDVIDANSGQQRWQLHVIIPFTMASYKATLLNGLENNDNTLPQFNDLLGKAHRIFELADYSAEALEDKHGHARYWKNVRFQTLGDILVRQADILLAVWDGKLTDARGGTSDVVSMALAQGKTVIRINPETLEVSCLQSTVVKNDLVCLTTKPSDGPTINVQSLFSDDGVLSKLISRTLSFPGFDLHQPLIPSTEKNDGGHGKKEMIFESASAFFGRYPGNQSEGLANAVGADALLHEEMPFKNLRRKAWFRHWLAGRAYPEKTQKMTYAVVYQWLTNRLVGAEATAKKNNPKPAAQQTPWLESLKLRVDYATQDWNKHVSVDESNHTYLASDLPITTDAPAATENVVRPTYLDVADEEIRDYTVTADAIATSRGHAYRSSYVINFLGGAFAVCVGLIGLFFYKKQYFVGAEVLLLLGLIALYVFVHQKSWHKRWLNARHIAESLRASRFLVWLGYGGRRAVNPDAPWTAWHTNSVMAASSVPNAVVTKNDIRYMVLELCKHVGDQQKYHSSNSANLRKIHHALDTCGQLCVFAAIGAAIFYLAFFHFFGCFGASFCEYPKGQITPEVEFAKYFVTTFCAAMPVLAGAFMGIRFQGDFERFAERSEKTEGQLTVINERLRNLLCELDADPQQLLVATMPPFENLSSIVFDLLEVYELDLEDWRFVYSARPNPEVG